MQAQTPDNQYLGLLTIVALAPDDPFLGKTVKSWLNDPKDFTRRHRGAGIAAGMGPSKNTLLPDMIAAFNKTDVPDKFLDAAIKSAIMGTFRAMGRDAGDAIPSLRKAAAATKDRNYEREIFETIKAIDGEK
jgi:hypothetical protein